MKQYTLTALAVAFWLCMLVAVQVMRPFGKADKLADWLDPEHDPYDEYGDARMY